MQAPTHVIAGVVIQKTVGKIKPAWLRLPLIAFTGLFFHSVFDRIARLTYHPPDPDFRSAFWVLYHLLILSGFIFSMYYFWKANKAGIFFSILPDFDWVVKHGSNALGISPGFYNRPLIHDSVHWLTDRIPPFSLLQQLPDRTHLKDGIIIEAALIVVMLAVIFFLLKKKNNSLAT